MILEELQEVRFYAKLEECEFHQFEMEFLGYIISGNGIHMDLHKVWIIVDWVTPISIRDVQCLVKLPTFINISLPTIFQ
jgi:hypothetical protein